MFKLASPTQKKDYKLIPVKGGVIACDTETTGLNPYGTSAERGHWPDRPFLFTFTDEEGNSAGFRVEVDPMTRRVKYETMEPKFKAEFIQWIKDPTLTKVFHNANFDITMIEIALGVSFGGKILDTKTMVHVHNSGLRSYGLKPLCDKFFGVTDEDQKDLLKSVYSARRKAKKKGWCIAEKETHGTSPAYADYWLGDRELCMKYGLTDTERTMRLYWACEDFYKHDAAYSKLVDMEMKLSLCLREMQEFGTRLDEDKIKECIEYYEEHIKKGETKKADLGYAELNTNSHKQKCRVFYDELKYQVQYGKTGNPSVDGSALSMWANKDCMLSAAIVDINAAKHQLKTFILPFQELGYKDKNGQKILHPNYNIAGPITGRISCNKPNLMNIPSNDSRGRNSSVEYRARQCFIPREDCVLYFPDYAQVEVWLAMFLSKDKFGTNALANGVDMHGTVAARKDVFGSRPDWEQNKSKYRKIAKVIMFGLLYGGGPSVVVGVVGCTLAEASVIHAGFWAQFPGIVEYAQKLEYECKTKGYITSPFGRKYHPHPTERYKSLNYMIQGTAADVMKRALINTRDLFKKKYGNRCRVLLTIHDELCVEIPKSLHSKKLMNEVTIAMQGDMHKTCGLPCHFKVGMKWTPTNWHEVIELEELQFGHQD